ncbi:hypothetical protein BJ508DRAFT_411056 [Ascobolus immersus RN42]|uniref:NEDD8-activating enzyme E1 catalytic subunit n=1 Tax=Ascobolus immersus RN42 TaxID=1160509 RepID=A0A3N4IRP4_ASCIM|nr:hypothetical protein BJ508DRAFT_411056 [Ascobolus immersus RN42]
MAVGYDVEKWKYLRRVLERAGPFTDKDSFDASMVKEALKDVKILVIGAGGLGCEILKNLALTGFKNIDVIDMDTIDVSNLNRQFLFRSSDVGQPKATCAANFIKSRVPDVNITPHFCAIQDKDIDFYMSFNSIICGLDSVEARRWINATLVNMVDWNNPDTCKPLIDGGTEGFKGQSRVILPKMTSCYECSLDMLTPRQAVPICTLATIPRQPAHCIEWASILEWPRVKGDLKMDTDDPEHITWLYTTALKRAQEFGIEGVTYTLTQGVVKNIIPAIASTNAIIAASCCNEAFKLATNTAPFLNNYMMYTGNEAVYTYTFEHERKENCPVCGEQNEPTNVTIRKDVKLGEWIEELKARADIQLKRPSLMGLGKSLYVQQPPQLEEKTRPNLEKLVSELVGNGEEVAVSDSALPFSLRLRVLYE